MPGFKNGLLPEADLKKRDIRGRTGMLTLEKAGREDVCPL